MTNNDKSNAIRELSASELSDVGGGIISMGLAAVRIVKLLESINFEFWPDGACAYDTPPGEERW